MRVRFLVLRSWFLLALLASSPAAQAIRGYPLDAVTRPVQGRAMRASSGLFDPESNADCYHVQPGQRLVLAELVGPGEIRHIWFTLMSRDRRYPRNMVLRIYWDHSDVPSVESPLGDFFAAGNGMRANVRSLPIEVTSYGRSKNCYWRMPFHEHARIEIQNEGFERTSVYFQCDWMKLASLPEDTLYFHARYRQEYPPTPFQCYTVFEGRGRGHYVGTVLSSQNTMGSWFGESDDRFYVDGEVEPSLVGTGLEDYFNDGWNLRLFSTMRRGVTICETKGEERRITAFRWHLDDPVPFTKSLRVEIERRSYLWVWDHEKGRRWVDPQGAPDARAGLFDFKYRPDWFSSVAYWYQEGVAPRFWDFPAGPDRLLEEVFIHPQESTTLKRIRHAEGTRAERYSNRVCNLKKGFRLRNEKVGGWAEFPFTLARRGRYAIAIWQCLHPSAGVWKVSLRGPGLDRVVHPALDFWDYLASRAENWPENHHHGTIQITKAGVHVLDPGDYTLRFECVGSNPLSRHRETLAFGEGRDLLLDLIAIRRLPITDPVQWMKDYLAAETKLFAGRVSEAEAQVKQLATWVSAYQREEGRYPDTLRDLAARVPAARDLPLDPWGQPYLFRAPGRFNPAGFDVWSRHGHARDLARWIGNWMRPYQIPGAIEGESLRVTGGSPGVRALVQRVTPYRDSMPLSGGRQLFIRLRRSGDRVRIPLPTDVKPGRYRATLFVVAARDYGRVCWSLGGTPCGGSYDGYAPVIERRRLPATVVELPAGATLTVRVEGKNPQSLGFLAGLDALLLEPVP